MVCALRPGYRMIYGRKLRQLFVVWGIALLSLIGLYRLELRIPALHEILLPVYWIAFGTAAFFTWRWVRARSRGDRRVGDRRSENRREEPSTGPET
jgi:hypothetical protein